MHKIAKLSNKGRITSPKAFWERLGARLVRLTGDDRGVRIEPLRDVDGSLERYAKNYAPLDKAREGAAEAAISDDDSRY
jgi:hypothetical protein